ncbi:dihydrolipoyl dehydrogenase [Weeksella virosa]|uniref:Dihydrolipoyl dehydrogenase n=1 Tax=Weeksella virosa (strain ATCC 43766 / DSM 16922 / JCM 21250 / CCUG 30538 / CDC 9751 / IAM 14551 / NBRC 16016 / NCTC 11634 / CL345/78) TaxID=865938 RepID=F0NZK9_WEEVC|nr:dihydrolipoyl dehydrogenase [Weeksella virosa]ADX68356.1 dihydrolipoamide dehydrogenase [Weeksella virosa DSM 16922]SUP54676.1 Dihydrolipoyl dehydrogenase [Weeksella virosa]VEH64001.1 Dihydrolipoyl dehydrogenase [Weeksella virosa]
MSSYDIAVIGAGPGGYVAAIRAAQLGFRTAIIEKESLGGTCLNVGCIPSKALLDSSHHFYDAKTHFKEHGIDINAPKINMKQMIARKADVVNVNVSGIKYLMDKNKIDVYYGTGTFKDATHITVTDAEGKTQEIEAKNTIIATGSVPSELPFAKTDGKRIITSTEALELTTVPKHLIVIGGGVIGLELGSVYLRLGAEVSVVEYADRIIPGMDSALSKELTKVLKKQGMKFYTSTKVTSVEAQGTKVTLKAEDKKEQEVVLEGDFALVAVGRRAYTGSLGLENVGVEVDERGRVKTNQHLQTNIPNIYAIGDVVAGAMLAHKAEEEGVLVVEQLAGQKPHINYNLIPGVVYTWPEVAGVGKTEEQLKEEGVEYKVGSFPFKALGRARASMDTDGFAKILADKNTDEILGMHIIGARAADLIAEAVVAMEYRASAEDIARMSHAHPTFAEAIKEAALAATDNRAIHS